MAHDDDAHVEQADRHRGDPWHAFGYLVSGVLFYGAIGWGLDSWLGTRFLVVVGILLGAGLGIYMTFGRFGGLAEKKQQQNSRQERQ